MPNGHHRSSSLLVHTFIHLPEHHRHVARLPAIIIISFSRRSRDWFNAQCGAARGVGTVAAVNI